jgi:hypothetical protein
MKECTRVRHANAMAELSDRLKRLLEAAEACEGDLLVAEEAMRVFLLETRRVVAPSMVMTVAAPLDVHVACPKCGSDRVCRSRRTRHIVTSEGEAVYTSVRHRCEACHADHYPFEERNDLIGNQFTLGARVVIGQRASHVAYARASAELEERGITVSPKEVDRVTQEVAQWRRDDVAATQREVRSLAHVEDDVPVAPLPSWKGWDRDTPAVLSVDGALLRSPEKGPQGSEWFECRAGVIAAADDKSRASTFHTAGVLGPDPIFEQLHAGWQSDVVRNRLALFIADGAAWIWPRVGRFFPDAVQVLDIYHAAEHVAEAAKAAWGEGSPKAEHWRKTARERLMARGGPQRIRHTLHQALENTTPADRETLTRELEYLNTHKHRMPYWQLKQRALPIGSGVMESAIKQVATMRLRGPGMKWTRAGADGMLTLRAAVLSDSLDATVQRRLHTLRNTHQPAQLAA